MTTHIHLMVTPESADALPFAMKLVGDKYVRYFNRRYERTGTLFEGRYRSLPIDSDPYWFTCMRYVEWNPVRARLVSSPEAYRWSSYRWHAFGEPDPLVSPHSLYLGLGDTPAMRQQAWRTMCGAPLAEDELSEIRQAVHCGVRPGRV